MTNLLDTISQVGITVFGVSSIYLVAKKNKWGFVAGLITQPFWFYTTYYHRQWGIFFLNFVYLATWCLGIYEWFYKKDKSKKKDNK